MGERWRFVKKESTGVLELKQALEQGLECMQNISLIAMDNQEKHVTLVND